ncbi:MAG: hypothetical protein EXR77_08890 [Myxococcales bacterium]|nr:hypothetical protein [Myxococcales bacterium]
MPKLLAIGVDARQPEVQVGCFGRTHDPAIAEWPPDKDMILLAVSGPVVPKVFSQTTLPDLSNRKSHASLPPLPLLAVRPATK